MRNSVFISSRRQKPESRRQLPVRHKYPGDPEIFIERSFTLIELLTVVAIIIILAALLAPVLSKALYTAQKLTCVNNQRQAGRSIFISATTNKNQIADYSTGQQIMNAGDFSEQFLISYVKNGVRSTQGGITLVFFAPGYTSTNFLIIPEFNAPYSSHPCVQGICPTLPKR